MLGALLAYWEAEIGRNNAAVGRRKCLGADTRQPMAEWQRCLEKANVCAMNKRLSGCGDAQNVKCACDGSLPQSEVNVHCCVLNPACGAGDAANDVCANANENAKENENMNENENECVLFLSFCCL